MKQFYLREASKINEQKGKERKSFPFRGNFRSGFSLVELLIVLLISAVLSAFAIAYSRISQNEIAVSVEASKVAQFILQAKELSISTYSGSSASCGYGVLINASKQQYSIFAYSPSGAPPCPAATTITGFSGDSEKEYTQTTWQVPVSQGVVLQSKGDSLESILFYPPEPTVFLSTDNITIAPAGTLYVYLATSDGKNTETISINPEGQVSF